MNPRRISAECSAPNAFTIALSRPAPIPSSPKSPGPPISAARSASAISSSAPTTPTARPTFWCADASFPCPTASCSWSRPKSCRPRLSPLFSWSTKLRMAQELFHPPRTAEADESVASFVERHYGKEMVDRLADPLLSGIYGGEAASLSVRAVLPRFAEMERNHGSLGRAMLAAKKKSAVQPARASAFHFAQRTACSNSSKLSFRGLNQTSLLTNTPVQSIHAEAGGWRCFRRIEIRSLRRRHSRRSGPCRGPASRQRQPRSFRRTRRHSLQLFHHCRPRL